MRLYGRRIPRTHFDNSYSASAPTHRRTIRHRDCGGRVGYCAALAAGSGAGARGVLRDVVRYGDVLGHRVRFRSRDGQRGSGLSGNFLLVRRPSPLDLADSPARSSRHDRLFPGVCGPDRAGGSQPQQTIAAERDPADAPHRGPRTSAGRRRAAACSRSVRAASRGAHGGAFRGAVAAAVGSSKSEKRRKNNCAACRSI